MQTVVAPKWNARTLGDRYEVTLEEKLIPRLGLKNLECFDAQRWQYQEELAKRRRERNAIQKRRDRGSAKEKNQTMTQTADVVILRRMPCGTPSNMRDRVVSSHQRQQLLYNWMTGKGWFAIPDLAKVSTLRRDIPVYDKHGDRTIERTLHRDADELIRLGFFIERKVILPDGTPRREVRQAVKSENVEKGRKGGSQSALTISCPQTEGTPSKSPVFPVCGRVCLRVFVSHRKQRRNRCKCCVRRPGTAYHFVSAGATPVPSQMVHETKVSPVSGRTIILTTMAHIPRDLDGNKLCVCCHDPPVQ